MTEAVMPSLATFFGILKIFDSMQGARLKVVTQAKRVSNFVHRYFFEGLHYQIIKLFRRLLSDRCHSMAESDFAGRLQQEGYSCNDRCALGNDERIDWLVACDDSQDQEHRRSEPQSLLG